MWEGFAEGLAQGAGAPAYDLNYVAEKILLTSTNSFTACSLKWTRANAGLAAPQKRQQTPRFAAPQQLQQAPATGFAAPQPQQQAPASAVVQNQFGLACLYIDPNLALTKIAFQFRIGNGPWQSSDSSAGYVSSLYYPLSSGNPPVTTIQFQSAFNGGQSATVTYTLALDPAPTNDCVVSAGHKYRWALKQGSNYHVDLVTY